MATKISTADVKLSGGTVVVSGAGGKALSKSLVQKNAVTLAELSHTFGFVHPEEITIGEDGAVHIANHKMAEKVKSMAGKHSDFFDTNCSCNPK